MADAHQKLSSLCGPCSRASHSHTLGFLRPANLPGGQATQVGTGPFWAGILSTPHWTGAHTYLPYPGNGIVNSGHC